MGYYYGYGSSGYDLYLLLLIPVMLLSLWAQIKVQGSFKKYSTVRNLRGLTGARAAEAVLRANGVTGVRITSCAGSLTDHYNPSDNTIYLSEPVYDAPTVAAVGVAAHEAGHAVQYAVGYFPIRIRSLAVPVTQFGSKFSFIFLLLGIALRFEALLAIGIVLFSFTTVFQLITLPVEFDASSRALRTLRESQTLSDAELSGTKKVLTAAALTYVAAFLTSLVQLLRYVAILAGRSGRRRR